MDTGWNYSTARMLVDYTNKLYMPLCNITNKYFNDIAKVTEFYKTKQDIITNWSDIAITQDNNLDNITIDAGKNIPVKCTVKLPNINVNNIETQVYYGEITENGIVEKINVIPMQLVESNPEKKIYTYEATIELKTGGNFGYTFRVMPKHEMLLDSGNWNLIKWITK